MDLPPPTVESFIEYVVSEKPLRLTEFYPIMTMGDMKMLFSVGKCRADPPQYSNDRSKVIVLFECKADHGHYGLATVLELKEQEVTKASVMKVGKIDEDAD